MASFLDDPSRDLDYQLGRLRDGLKDVTALQAQHPLLVDWWAADRALLTQAIAETVLGASEGVDEVRRDFLALAETLGDAAVRTLERTRPGTDIDAALGQWGVVRAHVDAWHALRGARQNLLWSGTRSRVSGRQPILVLSTLGGTHLASLLVDVIEAEPLTWAGSATRLNLLARRMQWHA